MSEITSLKENQTKKFKKTFAYVKNAVETNNTLAVVGRIRDWVKYPESRYPVSCTVLSVEDSMEGKNGIEYSWLYTSKALRYGAGVALDLSKLRPTGTDNGRGLVASGASSFALIYSVLNEVLRKGGTFKNGAVVLFLDASHPDILEFIELKSSVIPWVKRAVYVDDNSSSSDFILNNPHLDKILDAVRNGTVWLAKKRWYDAKSRLSVNYPVNPLNIWEDRLFSNVCLEVLIRTNATCLLSPVNLGQCTLNNLVKAFTDGMTFLCKLHSITGAGKDNYYLTPKEDKQVGLGVVGLANMLANMNITYARFTDALYDFFNIPEYWEVIYDGLTAPKSVYEIYNLAKTRDVNYGFKEIRLVKKLYEAYQAAARVAKHYKMDKAFAIAPNANVSYKHIDIKGFTTTPEISPPICHPETKKSIRDSDTMGITEYQYPPNVETAEQVGWDVYYKLAKAWQLLMGSTGIAHSISFNVWNQCSVDKDWFKDWLDSPLVTTYYRMMVDQAFADKTNINAGLSNNLSDEYDEFFNPLDTDNVDLSLLESVRNKLAEQQFAVALDLNEVKPDNLEFSFLTALRLASEQFIKEVGLPETDFCSTNPDDFCSACSE